jgi:DNA polymerase (family X)
MIQNEEIAKVLEEIGDMLEIGGENFFRVRAYRNAARSVRDQPVPVAQLSLEQLDEIPGIGADLAEKISTLIKTGGLPLHRELSGKFPAALRELRDIPGLGPKRLKVLIDRLHIKDRDDLEREARAGKLRRIRGFGAKTEEKILESLARYIWDSGKRIPYIDAERTVQQLMTHLRGCPAADELEVAGSFRRRRETVGDLRPGSTTREGANSLISRVRRSFLKCNRYRGELRASVHSLKTYFLRFHVLFSL